MLLDADAQLPSVCASVVKFHRCMWCVLAFNEILKMLSIIAVLFLVQQYLSFDLLRQVPGDFYTVRSGCLEEPMKLDHLRRSLPT